MLRDAAAAVWTLYQDALLGLKRSRALAPSPWLAFRQFAAVQAAHLPRRLNLAVQSRTCQVEFACAIAGLFWPSTGKSPRFPWHLPDDIRHRTVLDLPAHPLIDPAWCVDQLSVPADMPALDFIDALAREGLPRRWEGMRLAQLSPTPFAVPGQPRIAVCLHLYYPELWPEFLNLLRGLPEPWDLFITVPDFAATPMLRQIAADAPGARLLPCRNRGRDVLPWLRLYASGALDNYDLVCKLHTKRSPHTSRGDKWRGALLQGLLGGDGGAGAARILAWLDEHPRVGVAGPAGQLLSPDDRHWAGSSALATRKALATALGGQASSERAPFVAGTMFWYRPAALMALKVLADNPDRFDPELGQSDGTLAHGVERAIGVVAQRAGFDVTALDVG